jgi:transcriptional regulator with XRE-family HTH domain
MAKASRYEGVGPLLREWRGRRRLTQLELALDAKVSARHLSFVETGRSKPGREMLLRIAEQLQIPFRERNQILLAAGHAPAFPERPLDDPVLTPVRTALDRILAAHEPYPGIAFNRSWDLVAANEAASSMVERIEIDPALLKPPINVLRVGLHPRGPAPYIANFGQWRAHFLGRLSEQIAITGDPALVALLEELTDYPGGTDEDRAGETVEAQDVLGPVRVRAPGGGEWSFFGMFASFDTPFEVTTSELALELLFPADQKTEQTFKKGAP